MEDCIDSLGQGKMGLALNAYSGFSQMYIRKDNRPRSTLFMHSESYQYICTTLGLTNVPPSFQRVLGVVLAKYKLKARLVYLNYTMTYWNTINEHIYHVKDIPHNSKAADITPKINQCEFFIANVEYLGYINKPAKLGINHAHTGSSGNQSHPRINRNYTPFWNFATFIVVSSTTLRTNQNLCRSCTKSTVQNSWRSLMYCTIQIQVFSELINAILFPPALPPPQVGLSCSVDTDASLYDPRCSFTK